MQPAPNHCSFVKVLLSFIIVTMSFRTGAAYAKSLAENNNRPSSIALVTGGRSGIGLAMAKNIAALPFIDQVLAVSRSISASDVADADCNKIKALQADVGTEAGRQKITDCVAKLCGVGDTRKKQLRFLVHSAGTIDPIKNILEVTPSEFSHAMTVNCEAPFFLTTALYPFMTPLDGSDGNGGESGRVLHVSSGAAHGAPPAGWGCYGITKAAFFQSYKVLEREFRETLGGKVLVGSFKPGIVDTPMQGVIREATSDAMPVVDQFKQMKESMVVESKSSSKAHPPPAGALDSPDNVAFFAEYLLVGTTDQEFSNKDDPNEYDIRNKELYPRWIDKENLE